MKQGVLAIYDRDIGYACQLMEYLNQKADFLLESRVFTNLINLKDFLEENPVELLLLGEDIALEEFFKEKATHIMLLAEHGMVREAGEYPFLYKYQSMEGLVKELAMCYASPMMLRVLPEVVETEHNKKLIGVFSPFGGSGKTLFSLALGQALSDNAGMYSKAGEGNKKQNISKYQRVLYIGMELVSSFEEEENIRGNLSDILYWIRERKEGCLTGISLMAEKRGRLDCIFSPDYYEDLMGVTEEDIKFFLMELYKNTSYEIIIFDIGCWNSAMFFLLEQMDEIYMPDFLNRAFLKKENSLVNSMQLTNRRNLYEKIKKVELPFDEAIFQGNYNLDKLEKTKLGQCVCRLIMKNSI